MNRTTLILMIISGALACGSCHDNAQDTGPIIQKNTVTLSGDLLDPMVLNSFGRVSDPQVSPDGTKILYGVSYTSVEQNKSNRELFVMDLNGQNNRQITRSSKSESNARWLDNNTILFLSGGKLW
ncbi:MAG: peptidase S9, partial [Bacteroidales bacterium]